MCKTQSTAQATVQPTVQSTVQCLFCESTDVEMMSLFGQTLLASQYYCRECKSIFEVVRFDDEVDDEANELEQS